MHQQQLHRQLTHQFQKTASGKEVDGGSVAVAHHSCRRTRMVEGVDGGREWRQGWWQHDGEGGDNRRLDTEVTNIQSLRQSLHGC